MSRKVLVEAKIASLPRRYSRSSGPPPNLHLAKSFELFRTNRAQPLRRMLGALLKSPARDKTTWLSGLLALGIELTLRPVLSAVKPHRDQRAPWRSQKKAVPRRRLATRQIGLVGKTCAFSSPIGSNSPEPILMSAWGKPTFGLCPGNPMPFRLEVSISRPKTLLLQIYAVSQHKASWHQMDIFARCFSQSSSLGQSSWSRRRDAKQIY